MEKAPRVMAVPLACGWSDLGSWEALWQAGGPDADGVATAGPVTAIDCRDSYLRSEAPGLRLVGLGLEGTVAVAMPDAVLVAAKDRAQDLKTVVAALRRRGRRAGRRLSPLPPALGLVRDALPRHPLPGEADHGEAGRRPQPAEPHAPLRALDRGRGHGRGDDRRRRPGS
jgi:hypothetical protein